MKCAEVMQALKGYGSEQTRKTYRRHGIVGDLYGVKHGDLAKLRRKTGVDQALALELWQTGNFDARVFATQIADPARMRVKDLEAWRKDLDGHALSNALSNVAQRSPMAVKMMRRWMAFKSEVVQNAGWMILAGIAREQPDRLTKTEYREFLKTVERQIAAAPNRVRHAMNAAVISIGAFVDERSGLATAKRLGSVAVDHGDTSCRTPDAVAAIRKKRGR